MSEPTIAAYKSTQQELFSICATIYGNLKTYRARFAAFKPKYTTDYVDELMGRLTAAKGKRSADSVTAVHATLEKELEQLADVCLLNFQFGKGYINGVFPPAQQTIQYNAAGGRKYKSASEYNWENLVGMNAALLQYIADNAVKLADGGDNMPASFADKVAADSAAFDLKYDAFKTARQTGKITKERIDANNVVYADAMGVCADAQIIFAKEPELKKLFVWEAVKSLVSPPGSASLKIRLRKKVDNTPVVNTNVNIQAEGGALIKGTSNDEGVVVFDNIDPADYVAKVIVDGVVVFSGDKEVNTGTDARMEVEI